LRASAEGVVEVERRIAARPETVFSYMVDPDRFRRWLGVDAELDPRPGGLFRATTIAQPHYVASGHYVEVEPPTRLVFTWGWEPNDELVDGQDRIPPGTSTGEVVLVADGDSTILRLRHSGRPDEAACRFHAMGWDETLDRLVVGAAGGDPQPNPVADL
jgi:uncharacterized protein YndB with AHSA1/START domain